MNITKELKQDMAEVLEQATVSDKTARDILLICKNGLTAREALSMRGINNPNDGTVTDLKGKSQKWMLSNPQMQRLAHNVSKRAMQGKPIVGKFKKDGKDCENVMLPEFKHALAAASMVTDRTEPVKQEHSARSITNNIQVNIRKYDNPVAIQDMGMDPADNNVSDG